MSEEFEIKSYIKKTSPIGAVYLFPGDIEVCSSITSVLTANQQPTIVPSNLIVEEPYNKPSPIVAIPGCTDPKALNYYSAANLDDGSCIYDVYGCTNPYASNYNKYATIDDGSCEYTAYVPPPRHVSNNGKPRYNLMF